MKDAAPKVSACLITYNGAETVERALRSLLAQTYRDYEIVISDDHSTDETLAICERLAAGDSRVRFIRPERNLGAYNNMRFALSHSRGKYWMWAAHDDYWEPKFLERLVGTLEQSPTAVAAQSWVRWVSEDGRTTHDLRLYGRDLPENQSRLALAVSILTGRSWEHSRKIKNNMFVLGVLNRAKFTAALDAHRKVYANERQILCQLALSGEFCYVDQLLFHKTFHSRKLHERRPASDAMVIVQMNSTAWDRLVETLVAIARSPIITFGMKVVALQTLLAAHFIYDPKGRKMVTKKLRHIQHYLRAFAIR